MRNLVHFGGLAQNLRRPLEKSGHHYSLCLKLPRERTNLREYLKVLEFSY